MKKPDTTKPMKPSAAPGDPTPINISPEEGDKLRECAAKSGRTVADFVRDLIQQGTAKLEDSRIIALPCPFCHQADMLEIMTWTSERRDGTEYNGSAIKCHRCEAIAPANAWAGR